MISVYTDGSASPDGRGGWAWTDGSKYAAGAAVETTNQRMEMMAAIMAIEAHDEPIVICSDSAYVVSCFNEFWHERWPGRGWLNGDGKPIANRDLWERLIALVATRGTAFVKVKGHSGDPLNDMADRLAVAAKKGVLHGSTD